MSEKISLGVSSCLLGNPVRYDGGHKSDRYITGLPSDSYRLIPVCPEVECGLPVPREAMRLVGDPDGPRLVTVQTEIDHTARLMSFCEKKVCALEREELSGFIFKSNSPSCGLHRVKIYLSDLNAGRSGRGLFAAAVVKHFPLLPVEEERRLQEAKIREKFFERVKCYHSRSKR